MQYIEAPDGTRPKYPSVFLAGGITNCPDWQSELVEYLADAPVTVLNPRRANFPIDNPSAAKEQITWEWRRLRLANLVSFWFSRGSLNPIVLYEYGVAIGRSDNFVLGIDGEYPRRQDVLIQTRLAVPEIRYDVADSLLGLAHNILDHLVEPAERPTLEE